jgi:hypothetical protein
VEKVVWLLTAKPGSSDDALRDALLAAGPALIEAGALRLVVSVADSTAAAVPVPMPIPAGETPVAAEVAAFVDCHDRRGPLEAILAPLCQGLAGYLVSEALYRDYGGNAFSKPRDWPDGARSPGVLMLTLLERPARMTKEAWLAHWHGVQSPVSEELQPRMRYVRNEVIRPLTPDAPPWEGIVDECWPSAEHLTDPHRFYLTEGSEERLRTNLKRMLDSVRGFLELPRIRSYAMSEYILRSR